MLRRALRFAQDNEARFTRELQAFVRLPSESKSPPGAEAITRCAGWLARHLRALGLRTWIVPTRRHPIVFGEWHRLPGKPTVLLYGHYDVQPAGSASAWTSLPFAAEIRGEHLYGRGASDDKGQMFAQVKALESWLRSTGALPVNVTCLFEGEEEIGSPNLPAFIAANPRRVQADVAVISDTPMLGPDRPALTYGLRGELGLELEVRGPRRELHSGKFGGIVHNPIQVLCDILSSLHDAQGRIAIPGFHARVRAPGPAERRYLKRSGPSDATLRRSAYIEKEWGDRNYSSYERLAVRPSLTITGARGGFNGAGNAAVIPTSATAKLSFRLVPHQHPDEVERLVRRHLRRVTPPTVRLRVRRLSAAEPALMVPQHPTAKAASLAYRAVFGRSPIYVRTGGSIPVVNVFLQRLRIPTVLMGYALPDDGAHSPNERMHLPTYHRAIRTSVIFLALAAKATRQRSHVSRQARQSRPASSETESVFTS